MARRSLSDWYTPIRMPSLADMPPPPDPFSGVIKALEASKEEDRRKEELELRKKQLQMQEDTAKLQKQQMELELAKAKKEQEQKDEYDELMRDPMALSPAVEETEKPGMLRRMLRKITDYAGITKLTDYAGITKPDPVAQESGPVSDDFRRMQALELTGQGDEAAKFRNQQINQFNALGGANTPEGRAYFKDVISGGQGSIQEPPPAWHMSEVDGDLIAVNPKDPSQTMMVRKGTPKPANLGMGGMLVDPITGKVIASNPYQAGGGGASSRADTASLKELGDAANELGKEALQYDKLAQGARSSAAGIRAGKVDQIAATVAQSMGVDPSSIPTMSQDARESLAVAVEQNAPVWADQANQARVTAQQYRDAHRKRLGMEKAATSSPPPDAAPGGQPPVSIPNPVGGPSIPLPTTVPTKSPAKNLLEMMRQRKGK